jgi:integrase/recombinase XerC
MFYEESFFGYLSVERRLSSHTLTAYRTDLERFLAYCREQLCLTSVAEVRHLHVRSWIVDLMRQGENPRSVNRRLSCLKTYFAYLQKRQWIEQNPMQKVIGPKTAKRLPVMVQEREMQRLLEPHNFSQDYHGQFQRLIIEILYATGLRRSELVALKIADIDRDRGVLRIMGKGGKERFAPAPAYLTELLSGFIQLRSATFPAAPPLGALLLHPKTGQPATDQQVYRIVKKYLALFTSAHQHSPHVLRHSFATHLSDHGADLNAIKELLGHANLAATQVYMHNAIEKLRRIYEQAHPKSTEPDQEAH